MITLYTFGPYFGLPDASPFVLKAMLLLTFAGLAYREDRRGYRRAPKGKLPYIDDAGAIFADSTFIRFHIEQKYGHDFDAGLSPAQRGEAWAIEKMVENHLYWALVHLRWCEEANFARGPARFFDAAPAPVRPLLRRLIRRRVAGTTKAHGLGRHTREQIATLAERDLGSIAAVLGDKAYLMGPSLCSADAAVCAMVAGVLAPVFDSPIRAAAEARPTLVAYVERIMSAAFPPGTPH